MVKREFSPDFLNSLRAAAKSKRAKELRERLSRIAANIERAEGTSDVEEMMPQITDALMILDTDLYLKTLYGFRAKVLMEEAEYKRTGVRIIID